MGSQLTKNYDVEKEVHCLGGPNNVWRIHKAIKKGSTKQPVSVFIFDKKQIKGKSDTAKVWGFLNKDADELARIKHPNILSLASQPLEDNKTLVFITEPIEYSLAFLLDNYKMKHMLPGELESKLIMLELMEAVHFLHNLNQGQSTASKLAHLSICPENIYITKDGKVKLGGFNCVAEIRDSSTPVDFSYATFLDGNLALAPNLRFTAPEVVANNSASIESDIFSLGCVLYFLLNIDKGVDSYLLNIKNSFSTQQHIRASDDFKKGMTEKFSHLNYNLKSLFTTTLDASKSMRGNVNSMVENAFFQDPLIKTIRYLETLHQKEHHNVVQFLNGLTRILDKFDKRSCIRKVLPLMLQCLDKSDLSILILPPLIKLLRQDGYIDKEDFWEHVWPPIRQLCKAGEMPAQALYMLVDNAKLFWKFVNAGEFQSIYLPLLLKALEWGVHKLQLLGIKKVPFLSKKVEYMTFKSEVMPRLIMLLTDHDAPLGIKEKGWEALLKILSVLDRNYLRDTVLKALEWLRENINEPVICMHLLALYNNIASALTPEDIGNKILPGLIPMLISASFTK